MNTNADMVIFHEPDILEFASKGKSLGKFKIDNGKAVFWTLFYRVELKCSEHINYFYSNILENQKVKGKRSEREKDFYTSILEKQKVEPL